ncbi:LysR family transcriptional regulator [Nocardia seriolae]|uniref:HTH-type transcriptional regulator YnfL n=1 Tax=Nocardia seriolae TaxID=37332 RepID=A0A0B8N9Y5_9NOCA|nr:LysR substrate-binding domain-containing protein [Nocardia seriolae]APA98700.1 putative HTH-type transcriptional regulator YnfL [Nocardia seriolae]MTJ63774.1 LysR family transcriptional regulator [Nocardia seriolae]MTJ73999.1 LysR family transcriptional regulator [Nocardia seriolae]MTJ88338.1 LysR family transcriptional regulator [Nocardia seriolae]MTK32323.1 LysR family transcriptional regulator [Nocardia seriolae]
MDLDLRKLRYFAAVAEHRHFGRAAEQLYIAQPVLSRQIKAFEQELDCVLLVRTTRTVELTAAGKQLYEEAQGILAAVDAAVRRVQDTDRGVRRLVVAFSAGLYVSEVIREFARRHPGVETDVVPARWWEREAPLRDGRAQIGYLRKPFDESGLSTIPVGHEPRVVCMPATHPLAARSELTLADLDGEPMLDIRNRRTLSLEEKFELIASGHGLILAPLSAARAYVRPDLVHRPVADAPGVETCLVIATGHRDKLVREFLDLAVTMLRR